MPGIGSDRAGSINIAPIANFGDTNAAPKGIGDLMQAFRDGFITVDDLTKRGLAMPAEFAAAGQNTQDQLQLRPLARQQQIGALSSDIQLQPKRASNAMAAEDLRAGQIAAATEALPTAEETQASRAERAKSAQLRNALASDVPQVKENAIANLSTDQLYNTWTAAHGQPPPDKIEIPNVDNTMTPAPIEDWIINTYGQSALAGDAQAVINRPDIQAAYANYVKEARNRPLTYFKGDPQYDAKLRADLQQADLKNAIQGAEIKALPGVLEAKAKAAEAPSKENEFATKLRAEISTDAGMKTLTEENKFATRILNLTAKPNPTNAEALAALEGYIKLLDPNAVIRQGKLVVTQEMTPKLQQIGKLFNRIGSTTGGFLNANDIEQLRQTTSEIQAATNREAQQFLKVRQNALIANGIDPNQVFTQDQQAILGGNLQPAQGATSPATASGVQPGDVVTLKDGRRIKVKSVTPQGIIPDPTFTQ
jgi:hypothetical protein